MRWPGMALHWWGRTRRDFETAAGKTKQSWSKHKQEVGDDREHPNKLQRSALAMTP